MRLALQAIPCCTASLKLIRSQFDADFELPTEERALQDEVRSVPGPGPPQSARTSRARSTTGWRCCASGRPPATQAGFVGRAWPSEFGGGGRPPVEQIVVDQELAAAGAPEFVNVVGLDVLGPSLLRFGNDEQRRRYIPSILSAEEIWCQGFSRARGRLRPRVAAHARDRARRPLRRSAARRPGSPGASTRAGAACSRAPRTTGPKHRGISMLIVDMRSAGRRACAR